MNTNHLTLKGEQVMIDFLLKIIGVLTIAAISIVLIARLLEKLTEKLVSLQNSLNKIIFIASRERIEFDMVQLTQQPQTEQPQRQQSQPKLSMFRRIDQYLSKRLEQSALETEKEIAELEKALEELKKL